MLGLLYEIVSMRKRKQRNKEHDSGQFIRAVFKLFPPPKRKLPLNQPENCLVLLGWNVVATARPDDTQQPSHREIQGEALGNYSPDSMFNMYKYHKA